MLHKLFLIGYANIKVRNKGHFKSSLLPTPNCLKKKRLQDRSNQPVFPLNRLYLNIYMNITDIIIPQLHVCTVQMRQKIKLQTVSVFRLEASLKAALGHEL